MRIDILHVTDCPNVVPVLSRLREALDELRIVSDVRVVEVTTTDQAERVGMKGLPTILIDGRDPFPAPGPSLACRLYRNSGVFDGAPSAEALIEVLAR